MTQRQKRESDWWHRGSWRHHRSYRRRRQGCGYRRFGGCRRRHCRASGYQGPAGTYPVRNAFDIYPRVPRPHMNGRLLLALLALTVAAPAQQPLIEGQTQSTVRVLIYEDLQCSDCADFRRMMDEKILPRYADKAAFIHRDFPLAKHAWARKAAIAARYFSEITPELGLAYRRQTMATIRETTPE